MTPREQKELFVEHWLKYPLEPYKAAEKVFGNGDFIRNLKLVTPGPDSWLSDPEVLEIKQQMLDKRGARAFLPTKEESARSLWDAAQVALGKGQMPSYEKIMRQYNDVMSYIEKPAAVQVTNNVKPVQRVMVVKEAASDEDWERKLAANQTALTNRNVSIN